MATQRIEDMDSIDLDALVSVLLEDDPKMAAQLISTPTPRLLEIGDADGVWDMLNANKSSGKTGFARGELNIICSGGRTQ